MRIKVIIFLQKYTEAILNKEYVYLVECRQNTFPLFFDLDFLLEKEVEQDIFIDIIKNVNETVKLYYNNRLCIVTTADNKLIKKNEIEYIKKGFHLHWPDLIVNKEIALNIRKACIIKLKTIYGNMFYNNFNDIIDEHVFNSSGLRLTGSRKGQYVSQTKSFCDEGRPYYLIYVFNNNIIDLDKFNDYNTDYELLIKHTSIINENCNISPIENNLIAEEECEECEEITRYENNTWNKLYKTNIEYTEICRFFKNYVKDYSVDDIKRIFYSNDNNVYIIWTKSKYCLNISRCHN